jgi:hypothetical protein
MAYDFQIVVDATDPHVMADWWAETLGWTVEPSNEEFIRRMIAEGHAGEDETTTHHGVLVWKTGAAIRHPDSGEGLPLRRVLFQSVPEGKSGEPRTDGPAPERRHNRLHLDIRIGDHDREEVVDGLIARGARRLWEGRQGPVHRWVTMADIEGNEFCVA